MSTLARLLLGVGEFKAPPGSQEWDAVGTYSFTVPVGITQISVTADGAGGGGGSSETLRAGADGGVSRLLRASTLLLESLGGQGGNGGAQHPGSGGVSRGNGFGGRGGGGGGRMPSSRNTDRRVTRVAGNEGWLGWSPGGGGAGDPPGNAGYNGGYGAGNAYAGTLSRGGTGGVSNNARSGGGGGGAGERKTTTLQVTPGETLTVVVGHRGLGGGDQDLALTNGCAGEDGRVTISWT